MGNLIDGLAGLILTILGWIDKTLSDALGATGMAPEMQSVVWVTIVILSIIVVAKFIVGRLRTFLLFVILGLAAHAAVVNWLTPKP